MEWKKMASELVEKIKGYRSPMDGWKVVKEAKDVTVWSKPSDEWKGTVYKTAGEINADPEAVFQLIDPSGSPDCPRNKWDKSIESRTIIEHVEESIKVMHTVTRSGLGGLISSRDFIDLLVVERNDEFLGTAVQSVSHQNCDVSTDAVRGVNYPSAIMCWRINSDPPRTRLVSLIQTDLGGMLPQSLVDQALPASQIQFFQSLKDALKETGHLRDS